MTIKKLLFVALAAMALGLVPAARHGRTASSAPLGAGDVCAQTGTCKSSPPDICFVNGNPYYDREWVPADMQ